MTTNRTVYDKQRPVFSWPDTCNAGYLPECSIKTQLDSFFYLNKDIKTKQKKIIISNLYSKTFCTLIYKFPLLQIHVLLQRSVNLGVNGGMVQGSETFFLTIPKEFSWKNIESDVTWGPQGNILSPFLLFYKYR